MSGFRVNVRVRSAYVKRGLTGNRHPKGIRLAGSGEARVTRTASTFENDAWAGGRMYINETPWFETVPERVANFHIGGYRPARKWLKDRTAKGGKKARDGRILTAPPRAQTCDSAG